MKEIKKHLIIASVLLVVVVISYPLLMLTAYNIAGQDSGLISAIEGIKPVINGLYALTFVLGCLTIIAILYCWSFGKPKKELETLLKGTRDV